MVTIHRLILEIKVLFEEYRKPEVELGGVVFYFKALPAIEAHDVLEETRAALAEAVKTTAPADKGEGMEILAIQAILSISPAFTKYLRAKLFPPMEFLKRSQSKHPLPLTETNWHMAFETLDAGHIYELLLRAFTVNFFCSFSRIFTQLPSGVRNAFITKQKNPS